MKLKIIFLYAGIFVALTSCAQDQLEFRMESYPAVYQNSSNFGTLIGLPSTLDLKKDIIMSETSKYKAGCSFASLCVKNEDDYLIVATAYNEYDDFAFSELVKVDMNLTSKKNTEMTVFQDNLAKIQTGGNSLLKIDNNTILSFFFAKESKKVINVYMKKSIDNGLSWSNPKMINTIENAYQHCANNRAILLSSGRIMLPMAIGGTGSRNYVFCYYSDDYGETWKATTAFNTSGNSFYEPGIEELESGRLMMTLRNTSGKIVFAFSDDKGLNWIDFVKSNLNSPDAPSTIIRIPGKKTLFLMWNNNDRIFDYQFRSPLSLAISKDEGKTWNYLLDIENRSTIGAYYPTMNITKDKLLITYSQRIAGDTRSKVVFTEIPLTTLENLK